MFANRTPAILLLSRRFVYRNDPLSRQEESSERRRRSPFLKIDFALHVNSSKVFSLHRAF